MESRFPCLSRAAVSRTVLLRRFLPGLTLLGLVLILPGSVYALTAQEALANHVRALGGTDGVGNAGEARYEGEQVHLEYKHSFAWSVLQPMFLREENSGPRYREVSGTDGKSGWATLPNGVSIALTGPDRQALLWTSFILNRGYLQTDEFGISMGEPVRSEDRSTWSIPCAAPEMAPFDLTFSSQSWLLTRAVATTPSGRLTIEVSDYRKVGTLKFPFSLARTVVKDGITDTVQFTVREIKRKVQIEPETFERPTETAGTVRFEPGTVSATVPLRVTPSRHLVVDASVNDAPPAAFLLDTGAQMSILDSSLLSSLSAPVVDQVIATGGGGSQRVSLHPLNRIRIGTVELGETVVAGADLKPIGTALGFPIAGILGLEVFDRMVVEIRYRDPSLTFHEPSQFTDRGNGEALPVDALGRINILVNGNSLLTVLVDTGSGAALNLAPAAVRKEALAPAPQRRLPVRMEGFGGSMAAYVGILASVQIGQMTLKGVPAVFHESETGAMAGDDGVSVIGNQLLERYDVTVDLPRRQLILIPAPSFDQPFPYDRSGLTFKSSDVLIVASRAEGFEADIVAGDKIVAMWSGQGWIREKSAIEARFREPASTRVRLKILRNTKELERELVLQEMY